MHVKMKVVTGDITIMRTDVIVNAANSSLMGGDGVDGAIHRAAGPELLEACKNLVAKQGGCRPGNAVMTCAGKLPCKRVIHTVGPVWHGGHNDEPEILASCYRESISLAYDAGFVSIAFPCISTGAYGYPKEAAAAIALANSRVPSTSGA